MAKKDADVFDSSIFDIDINQILKGEEKSKFSSDDLYTPSAKDGKNSVYKSTIRFLPFLPDKSKSIIDKWTVFLTNQNTDQKRMVDCPSTIRKKSILQDTFFALKNSQSAHEVDLKKHFARRQVFYSLIQIVKDTNRPELEGKIMIFRYGKKIYDKIQKISMKDPDDEDIIPSNPFDLFTGKSFKLHIKIVSDFNNYDDSEFLSEKPIEINGEVMERKAEHFTIIKKYFDDNAPDLLKYDYKEWDDDTKEFVKETIDSIIPSGALKSKLFGISSDNRTSRISTPSKTHKPSINLKNEDEEDNYISNVERDDIDDLLENTTVKTSKTPSRALVEVEDDDDNDVYSGLE